MATRRVLLNIDVGELPGEPDALYSVAHIANIACGGHAGDDASMTRAVDLCTHLGAAVGAHPSYLDREGFGRRPQAVAPDDLRGMVFDQCERLALLAGRTGVRVAYAKPHGALYHASNSDAALARAVVAGIVEALGRQVTLIAPPQGALRDAALARGLDFAGEAFADRATRADGSLVPRGEPGALIEDPRAAAALATSLTARPEVATVCVHGDTPRALEIARAVRDALDLAARMGR